MREPFDLAGRDRLLAWIPEAKETAGLALETIKRVHHDLEHVIPSYGNFRSLFMGLVGHDGTLEYYGGHLRFADSDGNVIADHVDPRDYQTYIGEATEPWSYLKFPYFKPMGYPKGMYRVGPLARLNICDRIDTPLAEQERQAFTALAPHGGAVNNSFYFHYARLIELLFAVEKAEQLLQDPALLGTHVRARAMINQFTGVGASEAPRGTLFHDYEVDHNGVLRRANLLIATAQNNLAMNRTVRQLAVDLLDGHAITEGLLNRIEAGIRCFDPCLSCSTHAIGEMPLHVRLVGPGGVLLGERRR